MNEEKKTTLNITEDQIKEGIDIVKEGIDIAKSKGWVSTVTGSWITKIVVLAGAVIAGGGIVSYGQKSLAPDPEPIVTELHNGFYELNNNLNKRFSTVEELIRGKFPGPNPPDPNPLPDPTPANPVSLPKLVTVESLPKQIKLDAKCNGDFNWIILDQTPADIFQIGSSLIITPKGGDFSIGAMALTKGAPVAWCKFVIGPAPIPIPPTPIVAGPFPVDGKFRVLIVEETVNRSKLPASQAVVFDSKTVRDYLRAKCTTYPDGKTPECGIWDKDVDVNNATPALKAAMNWPHPSLPFIMVSNGKEHFEGPLPESVEKTMDLLKKYGGN